MQYWSEDTAFVVDELEKLASGTGKFGGRLDLTRLGAFGHSFGGAASAEFCLDDARCVAGINFDGSLSGDVEKAGVTQPFMQVFSGTTCEEVAASGAMTLEACLPMLAQYEVGWQRMFDASEVGYRLTIPESRHGSFSDLPLLAPLSPMFADAATIAPERLVEISSQSALAFFDRHLKGTHRCRSRSSRRGTLEFVGSALNDGMSRQCRSKGSQREPFACAIQRSMPVRLTGSQFAPRYVACCGGALGVATDTIVADQTFEFGPFRLDERKARSIEAARRPSSDPRPTRSSHISRATWAGSSPKPS